jgi:hypothetical protein
MKQPHSQQRSKLTVMWHGPSIATFETGKCETRPDLTVTGTLRNLWGTTKKERAQPCLKLPRTEKGQGKSCVPVTE